MAEQEDVSSCNTDNDNDERRNFPWVTMEPVLFLVALALSLSGAVFTQLLLAQTCMVVLNFNSTTCELLVSKASNESEALELLVEPHTSVLQMTKSLIESFIPATMSLFLGPWSDVYGRKPLLVWSLFGYGLMYILYACLSSISTLSPSYLLLASIPVAFSGGLSAIFAAVYSYISDVTALSQRAFRIGLLDAALSLGFMTGTFCSAKLFKFAGSLRYEAVFGTSGICCLIAFLYTLFIVKESVKIDVMQSSLRGRGLRTVFDWQFIIKMIRVNFMQREHFGRATIILIILTLAAFVVTLEGESSVSYLYTRNKFSWDLSKYTFYATFATLISTLGMVIGIYLFNSWLKVSESLFSAIAFLSKVIAVLIIAFAPSGVYMYIGCGVGLLGGMVGPLCRSVLSKTVPKEDIGSVFSLTSSMESLTPLAAAPTYTLIYNATIKTFPGAFYVLSASLFFCGFLALSTVYLLQKVSTRQGYSVQQDDTEEILQ